jgi:hypothetical protein
MSIQQFIIHSNQLVFIVMRYSHLDIKDYNKIKSILVVIEFITISKILQIKYISY